MRNLHLKLDFWTMNKFFQKVLGSKQLDVKYFTF